MKARERATALTSTRKFQEHNGHQRQFISVAETQMGIKYSILAKLAGSTLVTVNIMGKDKGFNGCDKSALA